MHEIVQEAIREQLPEPALQAWASAAVRLVAGVFPFKQRYRSPIPECNRLLAHGLAATQYAEEVDVAIVGTINPEHLKSNIRLFEEQIPISEVAVEELYRRFDQLGDDWEGLI